MKKALGLSILPLWLCVPSLRATVIDFENLTDPTTVTNQYSGVLFSSNGGGTIVASTFGVANWGTNGPMIACPQLSGRADCTADLIVDFTTPISGLIFKITGDDSSTPSATIDLFSGATLLHTQSFTGDGNDFTAHTIDLSAFSNVTRLFVHNDIDPAGLGFDDFSFTASGVPEPGTFGLLLSGMGAGLLARYRRRR